MSSIKKWFGFVKRGLQSVPIYIPLIIYVLLNIFVGPRFSDIGHTDTSACHVGQGCDTYFYPKEIESHKPGRLHFARSDKLIKERVLIFEKHTWGGKCKSNNNYVLLPAKGHEFGRMFCLRHGWKEYAKDPFSGLSPREQLIDLGVTNKELIAAAYPHYQSDGLKVRFWMWHLEHSVGFPLLVITTLYLFLRFLLWMFDRIYASLFDENRKSRAKPLQHNV